jgi:tungstate transport system ATP-binding protein
MAIASSVLPLTLDRVRYEAGGRTLLADISITLAAGARTVILGANGAGKSLFMRICHGLLQPSAGVVVWSAAGTDLRRRQAMVFQKPVLLRRSAAANLRYALKAAHVPRRLHRSRAAAALEAFGLVAVADRSARVLSGGEQQRLALARAWALEPEILFLDEPTASLDTAGQREVEAAVQRFHVAGTKIVMSTHDLAQAHRLADEIVFLSGGRLVEHAPAGAFFNRPRTAEAAAFLRGELVC